MTVQSEAFLILLGLDKYLPMHLEHVERGRQIISAKPSLESIVMVDLADASVYVSTHLDSYICPALATHV
jgi:hypothetical protein